MQNMHYVVAMDTVLFKDLQLLDQTGNFSQAAELANISQSAFSRRIKSLEVWVGASLVDRSRQPVKLTDAGIRMLEAGLQALARIDQERSQILEALSLPDKYVVTFGAQHSIGWRFFPAWLQALEDAYGPILSRLRADDLPSGMRDLKNGDVDFVIAYFGPEEGSEADAQTHPFEKVVIGSDRLIPVCKPNLDGTPLFSFEQDTIEMPWLRFGESAPIGKLLEPLFAAQNIHRKLRTVYENSMAGALRIRARDGTGVAWLPESLVAPDLASGILVRTGAENWNVELKIILLRNKGYSNNLTRSIWSFLEVRQAVRLLS